MWEFQDVKMSEIISPKHRRLEGCSTGKSFCFVRACVRTVWLPSGIGSKCLLVAVFPFHVLPWGAFPFPFWGAELSLFHSPHSPNLPSNSSWAYQYTFFSNCLELLGEDSGDTLATSKERAQASEVNTINNDTLVIPRSQNETWARGETG